MGNVVDLKAHRRDETTAAAELSARPNLRALQDLQAFCAKAIEAGGLDAGGPTALDFAAAVHRALKGTEWSVRFRRDEAPGL